MVDAVEISAHFASIRKAHEYSIFAKSCCTSPSLPGGKKRNDFFEVASFEFRAVQKRVNLEDLEKI